MKWLSLFHGSWPPILNVIGAHLFGLLLAGYVLALSEQDPPLSFLLLFQGCDYLVNEINERFRINGVPKVAPPHSG